MDFFLHIVGCQQNVADGQELSQRLIDEWNWCLVETDRQAEVVFVLACSVRQRVVDSLLSHLKKWRRGDKKIYLLGCILPTDEKKFAGLIDGIYQSVDDLFNSKFLILNSSSEKTPIEYKSIAYVTIARGCNNFCSYCAVPYTRGRERAVPFRKVMHQVKKAIADGVKEIVLLGQNVNSYKIKNQRAKIKITNKKLKIDNGDFIKLLKAIDNLPGEFSFNFISSNPYNFSDELIAVLAKLKKWPQELHLAMQSGDDEILLQMNRKCTSGDYLILVEKLRNAIPYLKITTDIIVGFPSETEEQFQNTVRLCQKVGFDQAFIAKYSPRPGTAAARLPNNIPAAEKKRRWRVIEEMVNKKF